MGLAAATLSESSWDLHIIVSERTELLSVAHRDIQGSALTAYPTVSALFPEACESLSPQLERHFHDLDCMIFMYLHEHPATLTRDEVVADPRE